MAAPPLMSQAQVVVETEQAKHGAAYYDDLTGEALQPGKVRAARREELAFMDDWRVWDIVPIAECRRRTGT